MSVSWLICMPTVPKRHELMMRQLARLLPQLEPYRGAVQVLGWRNEGTPALGQIRDEMLGCAEAVYGLKADYVSFVDDDDLVSEDFVSSVMTALNAPLALGEAPVDHVGFQVEYWRDGEFRYLCDHSLRHKRWQWNLRGRDRSTVKLLRDFTHLDPIRTLIAVKGSFANLTPNHQHAPDYRGGEDKAWVEQVRPCLSLAAGATEAYISRPLYRYLWTPAESAWLTRDAARCMGATGTHDHAPLPEHPYLTWHPESVR